jgi:hypothetical protein
MLLLETTSADLRPLRAHCTGDVVVAGERVWEEALADCGLGAGREPAAVVYPANEYDVVAVAAFARYLGLEAVQVGEQLPAELGDTVVVHQPGTRGPWAFRWSRFSS